MMWRHGMLLTLFLALGALAALYFPVGLQATPTSWSYADLQMLDAAEAAQPTHDLVAVYMRSTPETLQIRLDLLEHAAIPDYDLYIALDSLPGGSRSLPVDARTDMDWDVLLIIPSSGEMQALDSQMQPVPAAGLRVVRDPVLDMVVISLNQEALRLRQSTPPLSAKNANTTQQVTPALNALRLRQSTPSLSAKAMRPDLSFNLQVLVAPAHGDQIVDRSGPTRAGGPPPPPAHVLLAFWNTYPAYTPATALRRWNGAHTGALGGSHGLLHLLRAARAEQAPLALLDMKYPAWLSALDFMGGLELVRQMEQEGLLILPEYLPDLGVRQADQPELLVDTAERLQRMREGFGLSSSSFFYTQPSYFSASTGSRVFLADLTRSAAQPGPLAPVTIGGGQGRQVLPIQRYQGQESQAQIDGPSIEVRRALSQAALAAAQPGGEATVLVLGGDLPESAWGAPSAASTTLHYLKSRPWIHLLAAQDFMAVKGVAEPGFDYEGSSAISSPEAQDTSGLLDALSQAPANSLTEAAWQAALALYAPVYPSSPDLPALRANYRGQVWSLLEAAGWVEHPMATNRCGVDPDRDGQPECILASEQFYTQFEIESGGLTFFFQRETDGSKAAHQIIGPTSQLISGLSDPQSWNLSGGLTADPAVIPGAFAESGMGYQATLTGDQLTFTNADSSANKTYALQPDGLRTTFRTALPKNLQIPLLLDPWRRFSPGWSVDYQREELPSGWSVTLAGEDAGLIQVEIHSNAGLTAQMFSDAADFTSRAEKPDLDYPPGYFLPFPLVEIRLGVGPGQDTIVDIRFKP